MVPESLGIYRIEREIGRGGMGVVYLAHDPTLKRKVAVKVLSPELAADPEYVARFEREATSLAQVRHPNLIHIYGVGCENAKHYIAMEYIRGKNVGEILREQGPLPLRQTLRILGQVLAALDKVHAAGIVHRDLKPANIMIDEDKRAILMDFGLAKPRGDRSVTTSNILIGTPEYMAPELAEGRDADFRSDVYALAIILFEMLTADVPFKAPSAVATLREQLEKPPPSLTRILPGLPPQVDVVLNKALAKQPEQRYPTVRAMAADLRVVARAAGVTTSRTRPRAGAVPGPLPGAASTALMQPTAATERVAAAAPTLPLARTPHTLPAKGLRRRRRSWLPAAAGAAAAAGVLVLILVIALWPREGDEGDGQGRRDRATAGDRNDQDDLDANGPPPEGPPGPPAPGRPSERPGASEIRYSIVYYAERGRVARGTLHGRLLAIEGEGGKVRIVKADGTETDIPYATVLRIEPAGGE